jgi:hypothetical protein
MIEEKKEKENEQKRRKGNEKKGRNGLRQRADGGFITGWQVHSVLMCLLVPVAHPVLMPPSSTTRFPTDTNSCFYLEDILVDLS